MMFAMTHAKRITQSDLVINEQNLRHHDCTINFIYNKASDNCDDILTSSKFTERHQGQRRIQTIVADVC